MLERIRVVQMADLDCACFRRNPQITGHSYRLMIRGADDGEEEWVVGLGGFDHPGTVACERIEGAVGHVSPVPPFGIERVGGVEPLSMTFGVKRFDSAVPTVQGCTWRERRRHPVG
jgi:hypothetical protein